MITLDCRTWSCDSLYEVIHLVISPEVECAEPVTFDFLCVGYYCGSAYPIHTEITIDMEIDVTPSGWECDVMPCGQVVPTPTPTVTPVCIRDGDVNGDTFLTPEDALLSFQIYWACMVIPRWRRPVPRTATAPRSSRRPTPCASFRTTSPAGVCAWSESGQDFKRMDYGS